MLNQKGGSRTDTLIKLVLIFFISLLSFSVGTFVGKQFSDSKHRMAALESEYEGGNRETASVPDDALEVKPEDALTEKDIQKIAEEFTKSEGNHDEHGTEHGDDHKAEAKHANAEETIPEAPEHKTEHRNVANAHEEESHGESAHEEKHEAKKADTHTAKEHHAEPVAAPIKVAANTHGTKPAAHTQDPAAKAASRIAEDLAPNEKKPEPVSNLTKTLPSDVAASSIGKYTVQISSHSSEDEARTRASELKTKGFSAFVVPANVKGKQWYRVSIGLFDTMTEAKAKRETILKDAGVSSAFVQKIVQ